MSPESCNPLESLFLSACSERYEILYYPHCICRGDLKSPIQVLLRNTILPTEPKYGETCTLTDSRAILVYAKVQEWRTLVCIRWHGVMTQWGGSESRLLKFDSQFHYFPIVWQWINLNVWSPFVYLLLLLVNE